MNNARIAALLRELADEFEAGEVPDAARSRPRAASRPRSLTRPTGEATSLIAAMAAKKLKDKGFT